MSRVTKIEMCNQKYTKSQLNMRLKVVLDQERKDADPFDGAMTNLSVLKQIATGS